MLVTIRAKRVNTPNVSIIKDLSKEQCEYMEWIWGGGETGGGGVGLFPTLPCLISAKITVIY